MKRCIRCDAAKTTNKGEQMRILNRKCGIAFLLLATVLLFCSKSYAHFVWVYAEEGKIKVVFGEGLSPDQAKFLERIEDMKAYSVQDGKTRALNFEKVVEGSKGWFELEAGGSSETFAVSCSYGVIKRGENNMFLDYGAKYVVFSSSNSNTQLVPAEELALDIVPSFVDGKLTLTAFFQGEPVENVEVLLERVECASVTGETNSDGRVELCPSSRFVVRAKHVVEQAGEVAGQEYSEKRYYCTMVLDVVKPTVAVAQANQQETDVTKLIKMDTDYAEFPCGMTSFGAAVVNNHIYVIGGKSGKAHSYAKSYQNRNVYRLNLDASEDEWEIAGENLGLQGLAIVGYEDKVYRIGGLEARNKEGEEQDLHSIKSFKCFDTKTKEWTELPDLPEGRSSFDACVIDNHVYVVGGWCMGGEGGTVWATDVLTFDLRDPTSSWQRIAAPFKTRALAVRAHRGKLVVVGGIQDVGGTTNDVHFFDPVAGEWSEGPEVPVEGQMKSFGCSAVSLGDHFLVSTYDGGIYELSGDLSEWGKVHQLESGRFFHQMLPVGNASFALVGGSHMQDGSQLEIEVFQVVTSTVASGRKEKEESGK